MEKQDLDVETNARGFDCMIDDIHLEVTEAETKAVEARLEQINAFVQRFIEEWLNPIIQRWGTEGAEAPITDYELESLTSQGVGIKFHASEATHGYLKGFEEVKTAASAKEGEPALMWVEISNFRGALDQLDNPEQG